MQGAAAGRNVTDSEGQDILIAPPASGPWLEWLCAATARDGRPFGKGTLGRLFAGMSGFYPEAGAQARALLAAPDMPVGTLALLIEPYETHFPALWRAQAWRRAVPGFDTLAPGLVTMARGWCDVVGDLRDALGPRRIVILAMPFDPARAVAALCPQAAPPPPPVEPVPDTALAMLQRLYRQGIRLGPRQRARLIAFHATQPQPAPLAAFTPPQAEALRARYGDDLECLAALEGAVLVTEARRA